MLRRKKRKRKGNDSPQDVPLSEANQKEVEEESTQEVEKEMEASTHHEGVVLLLGYGDWPKFSYQPKTSPETSEEEISSDLGGKSAKEKPDESSLEKATSE